MDNDYMDLITLDELFEILMVGRNTANHLLLPGKIKCFRVSCIWKIPRASVDQYIREQSKLA